MAKSLKLVHSGEPDQKPNPIAAGGWHHNVETPEKSFGELTYRFGFKRYVVLNISQFIDGVLTPAIVYSNLDADMLAQVDAAGGLGDCSLFQVLSQSSVPFAWKTGVNAFTGLAETEKNAAQDKDLDDLLMAFEIDGGFCVPVHDLAGRRHVVIFMGPQFDNANRHDELVVEAITLFDGVARAQRDQQQFAAPVLTRIEHQCLSMAARGLPYNVIAEDMQLNEHGVRAALQSAAEKIGAKNIENATAIALTMRLFEI